MSVYCQKNWYKLSLVAPNMPTYRSFFMDKQLTCPVGGPLFNGTYTIVSVVAAFFSARKKPHNSHAYPLCDHQEEVEWPFNVT